MISITYAQSGSTNTESDKLQLCTVLLYVCPLITIMLYPKIAFGALSGSTEIQHLLEEHAPPLEGALHAICQST